MSELKNPVIDSEGNIWAWSSELWMWKSVTVSDGCMNLDRIVMKHGEIRSVVPGNIVKSPNFQPGEVVRVTYKTRLVASTGTVVRQDDDAVYVTIPFSKNWVSR